MNSPEIPTEPNRLVVEVIGQSRGGNGLQPRLGERGGVPGQVAHHQEKPVAPKVCAVVSLGQAADRLKLEARLPKRTVRGLLESSGTGSSRLSGP